MKGFSRNECDDVIQNRVQIMSLISKHGATSLKLYGSCLAKTETEQSDIDFLAILKHPLNMIGKPVLIFKKN